jgi:hypothetical protein
MTCDRDGRGPDQKITRAAYAACRADILVCRLGRLSSLPALLGTGGWKAARTGSLERLPYAGARQVDGSLSHGPTAAQFIFIVCGATRRGMRTDQKMPPAPTGAKRLECAGLPALSDDSAFPDLTRPAAAVAPHSRPSGLHFFCNGSNRGNWRLPSPARLPHPPTRHERES